MEQLNESLLVALLDLAQSDVSANVSVLSERLGRTRREVASALDTLDKKGLIRAQTMRLTFLGVARAAGLRSRLRTTVAA